MKYFKFIVVAACLALLLSVYSCKDGNDDNGGDAPSTEISATDFIGAWIQDVTSDQVYLIFNEDYTGSLIADDEPDDISAIRKQKFVWKYRNGFLTLIYDMAVQDFSVIKISKSTMTLMDEDGYKETYNRIKKSDVPGETGDEDKDNDEKDNPADTHADIKTLDAEPSSYSAKLKGQFKGDVLPTIVGFDYSYFKDFPEKYTSRLSMDGKFGSFTLEVTNIVDLATIFYRAVAIVNDKVIYGETKQFETLQGTYKIDGKEYKFIKVTGLTNGSFSMMQTELPPNAEFEFCGVKAVMNSNSKDPMTKGEMRDFFYYMDNHITLRYPSPEEWKYAATGASKSADYTYSGSNTIDDVAWFASNSNGHVRTIASKQPNELGFYDMSGNYAELTAIYDDDLRKRWKEKVLEGNSQLSALMFNTMWEAGGGAFGGCWDSPQDDCKTNSAVNITSQTSKNRFDETKFTLRLVYSRPD